MNLTIDPGAAAAVVVGVMVSIGHLSRRKKDDPAEERLAAGQTRRRLALVWVAVGLVVMGSALLAQ